MTLPATIPMHRSTTQLQVTIRLKPQNTTLQSSQITTPRLQLITQQHRPLPAITLSHEDTISQGGLNNQAR
ncbi:hypothetical protein GHT06_022555 [Daphnia sinensis]|uniref:Uncharacterized protein n=1 Tax=Daphnia sinensis TaxID=1820382 RepID=A0AAD5PML9_9CRUS|nr:hypothetical protein GHT06_022555 [Daphnia sinensis]